jgi:hypothetical protein
MVPRIGERPLGRNGMRKMTRPMFGAAGFAVAMVATAGLAQQPRAAALNYGRDGIVPPM